MAGEYEYCYALEPARGGGTAMAIEELEDLLHDELKDIYDAEKQLTKALPKLVKNMIGDRMTMRRATR
jgi:hypothetical protein